VRKILINSEKMDIWEGFPVGKRIEKKETFLWERTGGWREVSNSDSDPGLRAETEEDGT
jgi:hypothetical protein